MYLFSISEQPERIVQHVLHQPAGCFLIAGIRQVHPSKVHDFMFRVAQHPAKRRIHLKQAAID